MNNSCVIHWKVPNFTTNMLTGQEALWCQAPEFFDMNSQKLLGPLSRRKVLTQVVRPKH